VGCETNNILANIKTSRNSSALLIFDIFSDRGRGADILLGPNLKTRKLVIKLLRQKFNKIVSVETLLSGAQSLLEKVDSEKVSEKDAESFSVWLSLAMGVETKNFYNAGGHFSWNIINFRDLKRLKSEVIDSNAYCISLFD
jgi:hypothetical protein